jgi:hypothetical protein
MPNKLEILVIEQMQDVYFAAGKEVIEAHNLISLAQEPFAKMRADKARTACDQYSVQDIFSVRF